MGTRVNEIILEIMAKKNKSKAELGRAVGIDTIGKDGTENKSKPTDVIGKRLRQKNISIGMVAEMVEVMDYQVVIIPKSVSLSGKSDWYKVDGDNNE